MPKTPLRAFAMAAALLGPFGAHAGILVPVPQVPDSLETDVYSINTANVLTGSYTDQNGREHGFVGTLDGKYKFFDYGENTDTQGRYINDSGMVTGTSFERQSPWYQFQFLRCPHGNVAPLTLKGRRLRGFGSPGGLTDNGELAGQYEVDTPRSYTGTRTNYSKRIVLPFNGVYGTYATGVNNNGDIVGYYEPCGTCAVHGFVIRNGVAMQVDYPDANEESTELLSINDKGVATGEWRDFEDSHYAFLLDIPNNRFQAFNVIRANGVSNAGLVAVDYNGAPHIYCPSRQNCPNGAGPRIEVRNRWIEAPPGSLKSILCSHDCRR